MSPRSHTPRQPAIAAARRFGARAVAAALTIGALSCSNTMIDLSEPSTTTGAGGAGGDVPVVLSHPGEISLGPLPEEPVAADPDAEPILLGMINQENVDLGSFPEVRHGAEAAVEWVNTELGGVEGRPLVLEPCIANFTPERSQRCAQQAVAKGAVAVLGGLDIMSSGSLPVLEAAGVPYVGGIPVNDAEMRSPMSFQFSGGTAGAFVAFSDHIATEFGPDAKVTVGYAEYQPIRDAAQQFGTSLLNDLGVSDVSEVPFPISTTDYAPVVARAFADDPDAVVLGVTDKACVDVMRQARRYRGQLFLVGACAGTATLAAAGDATEGVLFNVEGPIDPARSKPDGPVYVAAMDRYAPDADPRSAATVAFRAVMNLWDVLVDIAPGEITAESVREALSGAVDRPSFGGHPYTCDGRQMPRLTSLCSPQQVLVRAEGGQLRQITDWIDVPAIAAKMSD